MLRSLVIAGLIAAGTGMVSAPSQAAVLPADGAHATETGVVTLVRNEDPCYRYGAGYCQQGGNYYTYQQPHYRRYNPGYGNYYYRPHYYRPHRWWRRW